MVFSNLYSDELPIIMNNKEYSRINCLQKRYGTLCKGGSFVLF
jgi:hypothetical protein